jgi:hypothetical protein
MSLTKNIKNSFVKGIGMVLSPYPDLEKNSFNKHKRHNQIKRWISSESMNTIDMNQNELKYTHYMPDPTAFLALRNDWLRIGNALKKAINIESEKMER